MIEMYHVTFQCGRCAKAYVMISENEFDNAINPLRGTSEPAPKTNKPSIVGQVRVSRKTRSLEVKIRIVCAKIK